MSVRRIIRATRRDGDFEHDGFWNRDEPAVPHLEVSSADPEPWPLLLGPSGDVLTWGVDREVAGYRLRGRA